MTAMTVPATKTRAIKMLVMALVIVLAMAIATMMLATTIFEIKGLEDALTVK